MFHVFTVTCQNGAPCKNLIACQQGRKCLRDMSASHTEPKNQEPAAPTLEQLADAFYLVTHPRAWDRTMNDAWHMNIPDVYAAFEALRFAAIERVTNKPSSTPRCKSAPET